MNQPDIFEEPRAQRGGDFEAWWETYPHKVGKGAARQSYRRAIAKADKAVLLDGVRRYIASKPADRPWCNPATWLNQERWLDEPAGPANGRDPDVELKARARTIARGLPSPATSIRQVMVMIARGYLTRDQATRAGWDLDDPY